MTTTPVAGRIAIRVHGTPIPQGSKRIVRRGRGKTERTFLLDNNEDKLHPWRDHVRTATADACRYHDTITGPVRVWLHFAFQRPTSHYRTGRNAHILKDNAPTYPGRTCGDIDKLTRAVLDALTDAEVWVDDSQVVDVRARKFYAGEHEYAAPQPGVDIVIEEVL